MKIRFLDVNESICKSRVIQALFCALLLLLAIPFAANAQNYSGSISGTVTDPSGAAVAGAAVTVINTGTNAVSNAGLIKATTAGGLTIHGNALQHAWNYGQRSNPEIPMAICLHYRSTRMVHVTVCSTTRPWEGMIRAPNKSTWISRIGLLMFTLSLLIW